MSDGDPVGDERGSGDERFHRRGFFTEGLRHIFRPLADVVERKLQQMEPVLSQAEDDDEAAPGGTNYPYPYRSDYQPPPPPKYLRPPGALPEGEFLARCCSSSRCVQACPVSAIRLVWNSDPSLNGKPAIEPEVQACILCEDLSCMKACPSGALRPVARQEIRIGIAVLRKEHCLRTQGEDCRICIDKCPVGPAAIDALGAGSEVRVKPEACTGCGVCQLYCPAEPRAIVVEKRDS